MRMSLPGPRAGAAAVTVVAALLAAACGSASPSAPGGPGTPGTPVTASPSHAAPVPGRLGAIAFTGPQHGYGLFVRSGSRCQDQVARTADGGAHFTALTAVISWPCDHDSPAVSLAADPAGDVFLYGPQLLVSHDSGATWAAPRLPGSAGGHVVAITVSGARSAWLVTAQCGRSGGALARCTLGVLRSADGGSSWQPTPPPDAGFRPPLGGFSGQTRVLRAGRRSAYLLAPPAANPHGRPDRAPLWFTGNNGASWSRRPAPCGFDALYAAAAVAPDGTLFVACAGEPGAGNQGKSIARSADGGRTWSVHVGCPKQPMQCAPLSSGYLGELAAPTGRDVFLGGSRSALLASHDGGAHWKLVRPLVGDSGGGTFAIVFFGRRHGLVLGDDPAGDYRPAIWHTSDGGARWRVVHPVTS